MTKIILVNGKGGVGKSTNAKELLSKLDNSAWIDIDDLIKVNPWEFNTKMNFLALENASIVVENYKKNGYEYIILSGGIINQEYFNKFVQGLNNNYHILYVWLTADKDIRDERRISRARDGADLKEHLDYIDSLFTNLDGLNIEDGKFLKIDTSNKKPGQIVGEIVSNL